LDNTEGVYKDKFSEGSTVDIYYDYVDAAVLTTVRFRGYIDGVFDSLTNDGWSLDIEGRDAPKSSTNEHFADTHITLQFTSRNNLDCWVGTTGDQDNEGNYEDSVLYNSGLILQVYDTASSSWKIYKDLSTAQKDTLKAQTGYTQIHTNTYVEKARLTMSKELAKEGDYDFYIYYDSGAVASYLRVFPEESIVNRNEPVSPGQNFLNLSRYGADTTEEVNRFKEKGKSDGNILLMRTKEDTARQSAIWIKDREETTSALSTDAEIALKATSRLATLKTAPNKGKLSSCALPSLNPGEKIPVNIPYIVHDDLKVNSFKVSFGTDLLFDSDLKDRETRFEKIFKDRIDETVNVTPTDNPNGLTNALVFDFTEPADYTLTNCEITSEFLRLSSGQNQGTCVTTVFIADDDITEFELRIKANQIWETTFRVSNNNGVTFESLNLGELHTFGSTGNALVIEMTLNETTSGVSPEVDKLNALYR